MEYVLRTNNLCKSYKGDFAVNKVCMNIKKGEIYGFIGRNGSGKTTMIRMITGLGLADSGDIELFGEDGYKTYEESRKRIGSLIETPAFYPNMTAQENMELIRLEKGIAGKECITEILNLVNFNYTKKKKVKDFSLGMKQKLGIAMALLSNPEFLILDEPINGLDPMVIIEMRELFKKLNRENNITILISSHILTELYEMATCFGIINNGVLIEELTKKQLNEKCKKAINLRTNDVSKSVFVLEEILKTKNFKVMDDGLIKVYDFIEKPSIISKELSKRDIEINEIKVTGDGLEDYFINLVKEAK